MRDREKERGRQTDRDTEREERGLCIIAQFFKNQVILKIHNLLVNIKIDPENGIHFLICMHLTCVFL